MGFFVTDILLSLPNHYTLSCDIKFINIDIFHDQFLKLVFCSYNQGLTKKILFNYTNKPIYCLQFLIIISHTKLVFKNFSLHLCLSNYYNPT